MSDTCEAIRPQLPMLMYGELSFDQEETVESHLETCAECRAALRRERELLAAFDQVAVEPSPTLLRQSREELFARLKSEPPPRPVPRSWWDRMTDPLAAPMGFLKPAGAAALIAIGFLGARLAPTVGPLRVSEAGVIPQTAHVRGVETGPDGQVRILLDETHSRMVSGTIGDESIRSLLFSATRDPNDPGLRARTVAILSAHAGPGLANEVRNTLIFTVLNDQNDSVRLKAMEGLRSFALEPDVRGALADVLLADANPAMRSQAIDLLMMGSAQMMDRHIIGVLQELMTRRDIDTYVRQRSQKALELVNASAEVF
jgi:hypothetical protein